MGAYYSATGEGLAAHSIDEVIGRLTKNSEHAVTREQVEAWAVEIEALKQVVGKIGLSKKCLVLLEFKIPRRGKRIDAVLLVKDFVFVIEFKVGASSFNYNDRYQVEDYALDLRDFHQGSADRRIVPMLVATNALSVTQHHEVPPRGTVSPVQTASCTSMIELIYRLIQMALPSFDCNLMEWESAPYHPTPTIIEAAQALYAGKEVREITRRYASDSELHTTTKTVVDTIHGARQQSQKRICFVTGVPGAGKTLVGLNIVHNQSEHQETKQLGVFLSGNGPLVKVLRESLARDRSQKSGQKIGDSRREVSTFIQNVHHFIDEYDEKPADIPPDHVVIFDEAQRAWDAPRAKAKFGRPCSEPEQLLEIMDRHSDWAVFVALVGGGQEINSGEAGLPEWGRVLIERFPQWKVDISSALLEGDVNAAIRPLFSEIPDFLQIRTNENLHLHVTQRAYRAQRLNDFIEALLENKAREARDILMSDLAEFPLVLTRELSIARDWLKRHTRGNRRCGLVASSGGRRLRAAGIDVTIDFDVAQWFLEPRGDVRASYALEVPATEFQIQGLELDWIGLCWDLDLRRESDRWGFYRFSGAKWQVSRQADRQRFQLNKYRVLLTRAREGLVIYVPQGDKSDQTRSPGLYDRVAEYLVSCGVVPLESVS